ncbi:MAG: urease accessory protein UreE [Rhodobacteraceae bacterium]|nr:MAG: urease accessory protein UreE [Paracoccaceae bacterium]
MPHDGHHHGDGPEAALPVFTAILGSRHDPALAEALHRLEHAHAVDELILPRADLARRRLRAVTRAGREVAVALPREQKLSDGAVLALDGAAALVVRVEAERWLRLAPADAAAALALGYHAGNLHWRVRFDGADLMVALEGPDATYLDRLRDFLETGRATASVEEGGA